VKVERDVPRLLQTRVQAAGLPAPVDLSQI